MMMHTDHLTMIVNDANRQRLNRAEAYRQAKRAARSANQPVRATELPSTASTPGQPLPRPAGAVR